ncbi:hypothetical protein KWH04_01085 [Xanthomonas campestris pv. trichodesmae]|nr:hypothetical protein [Xanthomonas citri]MBV6779264.1 hypothetical protein [Xanthomonas campestris pv. trichodesmae]
MATSRGIRNNNPGNIDRSPANKWQGLMPREQMTEEQRAEKRFEVFATPAWGIRALCVLLINYQDKHGLHNVRGFMGRWAPPVENDTEAYVQKVAKAMGVEPDEFVNLHEYRRLRPLAEAIIRHENGEQPYSPDVIEEGLRLAGIVKPDGAALVAVPKATTAAAVTAATVGGAGAIAEIVQQVTPAMQQLMPVVQQASTVAQSTAGMPAWLRLIITLGLLVAACASIYTWWRLRRARKAVRA